MTAGAVPGFDPEDLFGLRRALHGLPEELCDGFLARWVELGERTDCDIEAICAGVRENVRQCSLVEREAGLGAAWSTVASAMGAYLEWRALHCRTTSLS
jgi:hypothetical protein